MPVDYLISFFPNASTLNLRTFYKRHFCLLNIKLTVNKKNLSSKNVTVLEIIENEERGRMLFILCPRVMHLRELNYQFVFKFLQR